MKDKMHVEVGTKFVTALPKTERWIDEGKVDQAAVCELLPNKQVKVYFGAEFVVAAPLEVGLYYDRDGWYIYQEPMQAELPDEVYEAIQVAYLEKQ